MSHSVTPAPYGFWPSEITPDSIAALSPRFGEPKIWGASVICTQSIASESGRMAIVEYGDDGECKTLLPAPWDARSKAHEYGGGAYAACGETIYFVNASDQNIYAFNPRNNSFNPDTHSFNSHNYSFKPHNNAAPKKLCGSANDRYADLHIADGTWLYAVREVFVGGSTEHAGQSGTELSSELNPAPSPESNSKSSPEPVASIVAINTQSGEIITLSKHADFYAGLALHTHSGADSGSVEQRLAFIGWQHPNMPWDETSLYSLTWNPGNAASITEKCEYHRENVSLLQPGFSPDGQLYFISDQNNWWLPYCLDNTQQPLVDIDAEFATPQWTFGMKNWGFLDADTIIASFSQQGIWQLGLIVTSNNEAQKTLHRIDSDNVTLSHIHCHNGRAVFLAANYDRPIAPFEYRQPLEQRPSFKDQDGSVKPLQATSHPKKTFAQAPEFITFLTENNEDVYLWLHKPSNPHYEGLENTLPPVIILGHGGPTGAADASLNAKITFWTSRGFAVADVNYRGSTGFGRHYRDALKKHWGLKDVADLAYAAQYLADKGLVHPAQKFIKGSSAGGYTVLAALANTNVFNGGVSLYGVADLHALAADTHKFEKYYLDSLIGSYQTQKHLYTERSPIHRADQIQCPLFVAQGLDDKVVPPQQAESIVAAAKARNLPVTYLTFPGEGHGFRKAATLNTLFEKELAFYHGVMQGENKTHAN